jgi:hypothetical protein
MAEAVVQQRLRWREVDAYHCASDQGGYTVCRVTVFGALWFEAWRGGACLARVEDENSKTMRDVCQEHFERNGTAVSQQHENGDGI